MNRRGFLVSLLAAPVVAVLPDIRRPTLAETFAVGGLAAIDHLTRADMFAAQKAIRLAQVSIDTAMRVAEILSRPASAPAGLPEIMEAHQAAVDGHFATLRIVREPPPWVEAQPVRVVTREVSAGPIRRAVRTLSAR